jgi:hypothetical protein
VVTREGDVIGRVKVFCREDEMEGEGCQGVDCRCDGAAFWDSEGAVLEGLAWVNMGR